MTTAFPSIDVDFTTVTTEFNTTSYTDEFSTAVINVTPHDDNSSSYSDIIIALGSIGVVGVLTNMAVLAVLLQKKNRSLATNRYLINLAISDILMSCFVSVRIIEKLNMDIWTAANCRIHVIARYLPMFLGINTIVIVAIERFVAIVLPTFFRAFVTPRMVKLQLAIAWLLTCVELSGPLYTVKAYSFGRIHFCSIYGNRHNLLYMSLTAMAIPIVLLLALYGSIIWTVIRRQRMPHAIVAPEPHNSVESSILSTFQKEQAARRQRRSFRVAATCAVVTLLFLACWSPVWIVSYLIQYGVIANSIKIHNWATVITYVHCSMNPIVYFVADRRFRSVLLHLVCRNDIGDLTSG